MRKTQFFGHLIDVFGPFAVQQIENPDSDLARKALQQIKPLKRIDNQDFIRHMARTRHTGYVSADQIQIKPVAL
ncbi:hypothetical protein [Mesorhizobium sp.]|uniref:hypothetical protein n=1 Tax=Mesorhizobium sp. TaxID=1871066 RepID=UPI0025EE847D|nr:hypothetical protein [Mesorhizobium sp.]